MEYFDFLNLFDEYMHLIFDDVSKVFNMNKIEVCFICSKDQTDRVIAVFEEIFLHVSEKFSSHCHLGLRGKDIVNSDLVYVVFFLVQNI